MSVAWDALGARSRGMMSHLLTEERVRGLERAERVVDVAQELRDTAYGAFMPPHREVSAASVEAGLTRSLVARMVVLARWSGPGGDALAPVFLELDAENVRAILRGVAGGLAPDRRLAGSVPTPSLGRRALEHLARAESAGAVVGALAAWGHPLGSAILDTSAGARVDLFHMEVALDRALAAAASRVAGRGGRRMRRFVAESLDARNVLAALVLSGGRLEGDAADLFVEGGESLSHDGFASAASADGPERSAELLARETRGTVFATALGQPPFSSASVASRILRLRMERLSREARTHPISPVPVLLFLLRLRSEGLRLRHAVWAAATVQGVGP